MSFPKNQTPMLSLSFLYISLMVRTIVSIADLFLRLLYSRAWKR